MVVVTPLVQDDLVASRDEWLAWRRGGFGASDAAAIVGLSRYVSRWSLWADKCGLLPERPTTTRQRVGQLFEPAIGALFHETTDLYVAGEQTWCTHPEHEWARCTVDGFVVESPSSSIDDAIGVHEIKTTNDRHWSEIPVEYRAQVIWQMAVTGKRRAWVSVLYSGFDFGVHVLDWNDDCERDWNLMRDAAERLWFNHVLTGIPPDVDESEATRLALIAVFPTHEPDVDVSLDHMRGLVEERVRLKSLVSEAGERVKFIDNSIREAIGAATFGTIDDERVIKLQTVDVREYVVPARTDHRIVAPTKADRRVA